MSPDNRAKNHTRLDRSKGRSMVEWFTFGISLGIILLLVLLLSYDYFTKADQPPVIVVTPQLNEVETREDSYYLPFDVANMGNQAAESVQVTLRLIVDGQEVETSQFNIDFLADRDNVEGIAVFDNDPRQGELHVDLSFLKP